MAAKGLGKARTLEFTGLIGVSVPSPVYEYERIQFNKDNTITVLVNFYQDQAAYDNGEPHFHTESYQVPQPGALDNLINTELKSLTDFDAA